MFLEELVCRLSPCGRHQLKIQVDEKRKQNLGQFGTAWLTGLHHPGLQPGKVKYTIKAYNKGIHKRNDFFFFLIKAINYQHMYEYYSLIDDEFVNTL